MNRNLEEKYGAQVLDIFSTLRLSHSQESKAQALEGSVCVLTKQPKEIREASAIFLIQEIVALGNSTVQMALDCAIRSCGPLPALSACSVTLHALCHETMDSPAALETSLRIIRTYLLSIVATKDEVWLDRINLDETSKAVGRTNLENIVQMSILFPVQIANACHHQRVHLPLWAVRSRFLSRLLHSALHMHALLPESDDATCNVTLIFTRLVHGGGHDEIAIGLYNHYEKQKTDEGEFSKVVFEIMKSITSPRELNLLLRSVVRHLLSLPRHTTGQTYNEICQEVIISYLELSCKPILEFSRDNQDYWIQVMILSKSSVNSNFIMDRILCHAVALVLASCSCTEEENDCSENECEEILSVSYQALQQQLHNVVQSWSTRIFVHQSDLSLQRHVTNFILSALEILPKHENEVISRVMSTLMRGVGLRLESSIEGIRRDGMIIGEVIAKRLGQHLHFDELDGTREHELVTDVNLTSEANEPSTPGGLVPITKLQRKKQKCPVDPDEEYFSDTDESKRSGSVQKNANDDDDDDSVWDEELTPYALDDDEEDLRHTPRPCYLRECLSLFKIDGQGENGVSQLETALQEVERLVRATPLDLHDLAVPLTLELVRVHDMFTTENFDKLRMAGLVALAVCESGCVGKCLINSLLDGELGLAIRLDILQTLEKASYELCGATSFPSKKLSSENKLPISPIAANHDIIELRTRKWRSPRTEPIVVANKFAQVAPVWFYSLVSGFMKSREDPKLWGGASGVRFLSAFVVTLATIVECAGISMAAEALAKDLIEFSWNFRSAEVAEIRRAVIYAIANCLTLLSGEALLDVLQYGIGESISDFVQRVALEDSDKLCRSLAISLSKGIGDAMRLALTCELLP